MKATEIDPKTERLVPYRVLVDSQDDIIALCGLLETILDAYQQNSTLYVGAFAYTIDLADRVAARVTMCVDHEQSEDIAN